MNPAVDECFLHIFTCMLFSLCAFTAKLNQDEPHSLYSTRIEGIRHSFTFSSEPYHLHCFIGFFRCFLFRAILSRNLSHLMKALLNPCLNHPFFVNGLMWVCDRAVSVYAQVVSMNKVEEPKVQ